MYVAVLMLFGVFGDRQGATIYLRGAGRAPAIPLLPVVHLGARKPQARNITDDSVQAHFI